MPSAGVDAADCSATWTFLTQHVAAAPTGAGTTHSYRAKALRALRSASQFLSPSLCVAANQFHAPFSLLFQFNSIQFDPIQNKANKQD